MQNLEILEIIDTIRLDFFYLILGMMGLKRKISENIKIVKYHLILLLSGRILV